MDGPLSMTLAVGTAGTMALVVLAFAALGAVLWGLLSLVSRVVGRLGWSGRAGRRFDALDDAVETDLSPEEQFKVDVALMERTRGHDPHTR